MVAQSTTSLRRAEKALYRELCTVFARMQKLDAEHCSNEVYHGAAMVYEQISEEHFAVCRELERRYQEHMAARHTEEEAGRALQADRSDYLWDSSAAD